MCCCWDSVTLYCWVVSINSIFISVTQSMITDSGCEFLTVTTNDSFKIIAVLVTHGSASYN